MIKRSMKALQLTKNKGRIILTFSVILSTWSLNNSEKPLTGLNLKVFLFDPFLLQFDYLSNLYISMTAYR